MFRNFRKPSLTLLDKAPYRLLPLGPALYDTSRFVIEQALIPYDALDETAEICQIDQWPGGGFEYGTKEAQAARQKADDLIPTNPMFMGLAAWGKDIEHAHVRPWPVTRTRVHRMNGSGSAAHREPGEHADDDGAEYP
jgi:hypothetical protein